MIKSKDGMITSTFRNNRKGRIVKGHGKSNVCSRAHIRRRNHSPRFRAVGGGWRADVHFHYLVMNVLNLKMVKDLGVGNNLMQLAS